MWVSEVGVSTFGAEEVQDWGLGRIFELLRGRAPRIHWYSLYDLPAAWPATTRHKEAEGSSYYRHFHMGLLDEHGRPKLAARRFADCTPDFGLCQWFHFEDHRLDDAVRVMKDMGVTYLRTGPELGRLVPPRCRGVVRSADARARRLSAVTVTFCFTPEHKGTWPHYTAHPRPPRRSSPISAPPCCAAMRSGARQHRKAAATGHLMLTIASVAYPLAPVGPDAVGGAEQVLSALDRGLVGRRAPLHRHRPRRLRRRRRELLPPCRLWRGEVDDATREAARAATRARIAEVIGRVDLIHMHGIDFADYLPAGRAAPVLATLHLPPGLVSMPEALAPTPPDARGSIASRPPSTPPVTPGAVAACHRSRTAFRSHAFDRTAFGPAAASP